MMDTDREQRWQEFRRTWSGCPDAGAALFAQLEEQGQGHKHEWIGAPVGTCKIEDCEMVIEPIGRVRHRDEW